MHVVGGQSPVLLTSADYHLRWLCLDFIYCIRRFVHERFSELPRTGLLSSVVPSSPRRPRFAIMAPSGQGHPIDNYVEAAPRQVLVARGFARQLLVASSARAVRFLTSHSSTQFRRKPNAELNLNREPAAGRSMIVRYVYSLSSPRAPRPPCEPRLRSSSVSTWCGWSRYWCGLFPILSDTPLSVNSRCSVATVCIASRAVLIYIHCICSLPV